MKFITAEEAAIKWNVSVRLVQRYCRQGRIDGVKKREKSGKSPLM